MFLESKQPGGNFHSVRGGIERNNIHQQQRQAYKQWSRSQYSYQNTGTSAFKTDEEEVKERQLRNDMLKTKIKSILASQETSFIKAKKVASIIYPHFLDNIAVSNEEYESDKDAIDKVLQSYYLQRPRPSHTITNSDNSTTMTSAHHPSDALFPQDDQLDHELIMGKASDRSEEGDWRMMTTNKQAFVPLSKEEFHERVSRINGKLQSVDIKRLVLVNIDNFARRFSYFKELTTAWIDVSRNVTSVS